MAFAKVWAKRSNRERIRALYRMGADFVKYGGMDWPQFFETHSLRRARIAEAIEDQAEEERLREASRPKGK